MKVREWMLAVLLAGSTAAVAMAQSDKQYVPQLADMMNAAQIRHEKLYLAGRVRNWELAAFEARQLAGNLRDAAVFYSGIPIDNVVTLADRLKAVSDAIDAKDGQRFSKAFGELTGGCNQCHQSMERSFIVMKQPSDQPFGDQQFSPRAEH
jgi:hypothetical protein